MKDNNNNSNNDLKNEIKKLQHQGDGNWDSYPAFVQLYKVLEMIADKLERLECKEKEKKKAET